MTRAYKPRVNNGGNYCGHNKLSPRLTIECQTESLPLVLSRLQDRLREEYYWRPGTIPDLCWRRSRRRTRSERREAHCLILLTILNYVDLQTLVCAIPDERGILGCLSIEAIAKLAGLGFRRTERVVADLKASGILVVKERAERKDDGTYKGIAAVKAVSWRLWQMFSLDKMLKRERDKRSRAGRRHRLPVISSRQKGRVGLATDRLRKTLDLGHGNDAGSQARREEQLGRMYAQVMQEHPDWPADRIRFEARQRLS